MGINVQVCWEKFANYWDVEMRLVPMEGDRFNLSAEEAVAHCDENTIGVVAILGSTFDGSYEPVAEICAALDDLQARDGPRRAGARGRRLRRRSSRRSSIPTSSGTSGCRACASINASGHKYGLVYPGVGWVVWRDADALPEDLIFWVNYLGDNMPTFALNFSRPGAQVVGAVLQLPPPRASRATARCRATRATSRRGSSAGSRTLGPFRLLTRGDELPVFAFTLTDDDRQLHGLRRLERRCASAAGRCRPTPSRPNRDGPRGAARRGAARASRHDLADLLVADLQRQLPRLERQPEPVHIDEGAETAFHH